MGFPGGASLKELPGQQEPKRLRDEIKPKRWIQSLESERSLSWKWKPFPVFLPEKSYYGYRSLAGSSP